MQHAFTNEKLVLCMYIKLAINYTHLVCYQCEYTVTLLWTEFCNKPEDVDYLLFPRLAALAEVAWTPTGTKD